MKALQVRFGATSFNDPMEALISLKISTKVAAYKSQLIAISNRIKGLFEKHKLKFFLKVLKDNINLDFTNVCPKGTH